MTYRGELERGVMQILWDSPDGVTAQYVRAELRPAELAVTTVLTVLNRLINKGQVTRTEDGRAHLYFPARSRDEILSALMTEALGTAPTGSDREAVLARFVGSIDDSDADALRRLMRRKTRKPS